MMKKYFIYSLIFLTLNQTSFAKRIIKTGVYNFEEIVNTMFYEPDTRKTLNTQLINKFFLMKMLNQNTSFPKYPRIKNLSDNQKIEIYSQYFYNKSQQKYFKTSLLSKMKSRENKKNIITGITLAQEFSGYNLILNNSPLVLYFDTSLNKQIVKALAFYLNSKNS